MASAAKDRMRVYRERRRSGKGVVPVVVVSDEVATIETLVAAKLLKPTAIDDGIAVATAVGRLVDALVKEHTNRSLER